MIVHDLPAEEKPRVSRCERGSRRLENKGEEKQDLEFIFMLWCFRLLEISLGRSDVDGSLQLLLTVVVVVHQLTVPQHKPAHLPVSAAPREKKLKERPGRTQNKITCVM